MPLTKLRNLLVPQDTLFFDLMEKQAEIANSAAHELSEIFKEYSGVPEKAARIKELENQGDLLMRDIYIALNKTFIVPIDHSDISSLASSLDDVLDMVDDAANLLIIYKIEKPTPAMAKLASILARQTKELRSAVSAIHSAKTYDKVSGHFAEIKNLEIKADEIYTQALAELFTKKDAIEVLKEKELLDCLENAVDKADKTAHYISDIVMKHS
ncbi:MAG: DUF47 family protein [Candidatus Micrarchaeota archaeon]|nr:DUF47 family protein [Candidatus Micrarchaeota archaeon]